jgi:hypothetical protein
MSNRSQTALFSSHVKKMSPMPLISYGWRNYLSDLLGLDKTTFRLAQGTLGLQTGDSSTLFLISDAVPPAGSVLYDASSLNKRSSAYLSLLNALLPEQNPAALSSALGVRYAAWVSWKAANAPKVGESYLSYFQRWATEAAVEPSVLASATQRITEAQGTPLMEAFAAYAGPAGWQSFTNSAGGAYTLPIYSATRESAVLAIAEGSKVDVNFDSGDVPNPDSTSHRVTIVGTIGSYATLSCGPGPWYSSAEVTRAFNGKGNKAIWDAGSASGGWETFFAPNSGSLARYVSQLALISDYVLTVTVHGEIRDIDLNQVAGPITQGLTYKRNLDSTLGAVHTLEAGKIQIWGVNVQVTAEQPACQILVKNTGWFYSRFTVCYQQNGKKLCIESGTFDRGTSKSVSIPGDASGISVKIEEMYLLLPEKWSTVYETGFSCPVSKSYEISGTTLDASWRELPTY